MVVSSGKRIMQGHRRIELTPREQEVYDLLQQGLKHKEIAEKLGISLQRVGALHKNLRLRILNKQEMRKPFCSENC